MRKAIIGLVLGLALAAGIVATSAGGHPTTSTAQTVPSSGCDACY